MLKPILKVVFGVLCIFALMAQVNVAAPPPQPKPVKVVFETDAGNITMEVDTVHAPITSANFLKYVDAGLYDGSRFFRTVRPDTETRKDVPIDVIVADLEPGRNDDKFPPIPLERTSVTGLKHLTGEVSMGRNKEADSAQTELFICLADTPSLDFGGMRNADGQGFAAFAKVVEGMDVVRKIWQMPAEKQRLATPVKIIKAHRA
jgi:peptidyl-prolyl cis-trans isomerase A (cyclophilin A)